jgi:hypothetical protein
MVSLARDIDELHLAIERACAFRFLKRLDLDGQGRFALGYHHQRAYQIQQAQASKQDKASRRPFEEKIRATAEGKPNERS